MFHDGVVVTPNAERFTLWRKAYRMLDHIPTARCAILNMQDTYPSPELTAMDAALETEYHKHEDTLWLYSEDIVRFAPEEDQEMMHNWAMDCDKQWDGNQWIDID